jgi:hypothetical protein
MQLCLVLSVVVVVSALEVVPRPCTGASAGLFAAECVAWQDLYVSTNGENWETCSDNKLDPCGCFLVYCSNDGHITNLYLNSNNLHSTIPESLGDLSHLTDLRLHNNSLNSTIPDSLGNLVLLLYLNLQMNNLKGTIPGSLGSLSRLTALALCRNRRDPGLADQTVEHNRFLCVQQQIDRSGTQPALRPVHKRMFHATRTADQSLRVPTAAGFRQVLLWPTHVRWNIVCRARRRILRCNFVPGRQRGLHRRLPLRQRGRRRLPRSVRRFQLCLL